MSFAMSQEYLAKETLEDLVSILSKGKVADRLLDFMPPIKRSADEFATHFKVSTHFLCTPHAAKKHATITLLRSATITLPQ